MNQQSTDRTIILAGSPPLEELSIKRPVGAVVAINFPHISFFGAMIEHNGYYAIGSSPLGHYQASANAKKLLSKQGDSEINYVLTFNVAKDIKSLSIDVETRGVRAAAKEIFEINFGPHISQLVHGLPVAFRWA